jgi:hypothetical protein
LLLSEPMTDKIRHVLLGFFFVALMYDVGGAWKSNFTEFNFGRRLWDEVSRSLPWCDQNEANDGRGLTRSGPQKTRTDSLSSGDTRTQVQDERRVCVFRDTALLISQHKMSICVC